MNKCILQCSNPVQQPGYKQLWHKTFYYILFTFLIFNKIIFVARNAWCSYSIFTLFRFFLKYHFPHWYFILSCLMDFVVTSVAFKACLKVLIYETNHGCNSTENKVSRLLCFRYTKGAFISCFQSEL